MVLRPTSVYIEGEIRLLYIFHFSLFLYYTISFLIIYYLIIMKVIVWLRSKLLSLANCLHVSPGHKLCIYRHVITSKFTLWWSDKLKHEWKHYCIYYSVDYVFIIYTCPPVNPRWFKYRYDAQIRYQSKYYQLNTQINYNTPSRLID